MNSVRTSLFVALVAGILPTQAAILANYQFTTTTPTSEDTHSESTAGNMTDGTGMAGTYGNSLAYVPSNQTGTTLDTNDYFEFTVTPTIGYTLSAGKLTFGTAFYGNQVVSGNATWVVRSSIDNFSANLASFGPQNYVRTTTDTSLPLPYPAPTFESREVLMNDLTIPQGAALTLRIYVMDSTSAPERLNAINNVVFEGDTLPIPEPSASLLLGAAGVLVLSRRRKSRHDFASH